MSTSRRKAELLQWVAAVVAVAVAVGSQAGAVEPLALIDGLARPTGLAVWSPPSGEALLLVAEANAGRVVALPLGGDQQQEPRVLIDGFASGPIRLAVTGESMLIAAGQAIIAYDLSADAPREFARVEAPATATAVSADADYAFLLIDGALYRSRRVAGRMTDLRRADQQGLSQALAIAPGGYLAALRTKTESALQLEFLSPVAADRPAPAIPIDGLVAPIALAYSADQPGRECLYALQSDEQGGLYRIDATLDAAGRQRGAARLVAAIEQPTALVALGSGNILVATHDAQRGGQVLRYNDPAVE